MAGILQESFVLKIGHLPLVNHFIYDANTWISEDEHLLEFSKQDFSATARTFSSNGLVLRHFQVQLWLEVISYQDRF